MTDFKREQRYMVVKVADVREALMLHEQLMLEKLMEKVAAWRHANGKNELEGVFIESDWPIHEAAWTLVERLHNKENKG